jgi:hypothetical protein
MSEWLTSLAFHLLALGAVLLVPAGPLRKSAPPPRELDVVFRPPRVEVPVPQLPLAPPRAAAVGPLRPERPAPAVVHEVPRAARLDVPPSPPVVEEPPQPQVEKHGILAFRDQFASLAQERVVVHLGAEARYVDADDVGASPMATRSMLSTGPGSSGGVNVAALSRGLGGGGAGDPLQRDAGGGGGQGGVGVSRPTSAIASIGGGERPLAHGGPGPARTDEEIQIVFDRHKSSFYRLYHRELRNDPTLQGQMVLRLTIEPDGSVSMCVLQSSDMAAPDLAAQVVSRVLTINFGAKEGVQALTIVYPIDFLPAA